jgi:hypothetical protein
MKSLNDTTGYSQQEATSTTTTQALPQAVIGDPTLHASPVESLL